MSDSHDLDLTVSALKAGLTDLGPGGAIEIDRWTAKLSESDDPDLQTIGRDLDDLGAYLTDGATEPAKMAELLVKIGHATVASAQKADDQEVARKLRELGNELVEGGQTLTK